MKIEEYGYIDYNDLTSLCDKLGLYYSDEDGTIRNPYLRGESRCDRALRCSYFRKKECDYIVAKSLFGELYRESTYFGIHISEKLEQATCPSEIVYMILQQHRGIYTPLLDVSSDVYAPLYFACKDNKELDGQLYLFRKSKNSSIITEFFSATDIESTNDRTKKQSSGFALTYGYKNDKLEFYDISRSEVVAERYLIHDYDKEKILEDLREFLNCRDLDKYFGFMSRSIIDRYMKMLHL